MGLGSNGKAIMKNLLTVDLGHNGKTIIEGTVFLSLVEVWVYIRAPMILVAGPS